MGFVLAWLVSKEGVAAVGAGVLALWTYATRKSKRRAELDKLADVLFAVAEEVGVRDKLDGPAKWKRFIALLYDHAQGEGLGKLSADDVQRYKLRAERLAWLAKGLRFAGAQAR